MRDPASELRLSEIVAALSHALDLTEGQPAGHAARTCLIGMRLAEEVGVPSGDRSALFYALLLKDAGCSANASRLSALFGSDDRRTKRDRKLVDWANTLENARFSLAHAGTGRPVAQRLRHAVRLGRAGPQVARDLIETRCERGAQIARMLDLPEIAAQAIGSLDEHWDGRGQPIGLVGAEIPFLARILGLAQTVEVFFWSYGLEAACRMALQRSGRWFEPALVSALLATRRDAAFWRGLAGEHTIARISQLEPPDRVVSADDEQLDRVAEAFAKVVDAKSPYTYRHSERVAEVAVAIAGSLGYAGADLRELRRASLLHDIGKLGVSSLILDKPGRLTDAEFAEIKRHPEYGEKILGRIEHFTTIAGLAGAHHERLDGSGYPRGLAGEEISREVRILAVADVYEALTAERPYRAAMQQDRALELMREEAGTKLCAEAFDALEGTLVRESGLVAA